MMDSRAAILGRLKTDLSTDRAIPQQVRPCFARNLSNLALRLKQKLKAAHASVDIVRAGSQVGESIIHFLQSNDIPLEVATVPLTGAAELPLAQGLHFYPCEDYAACTTIMTRADCAIAETGSLVFSSSPERPTLANFLPDNCIVILDEQDIVPYIEDAFQKVKDAEAGMPRALNLVSGPSKTADIEQTLVYGAHGPIRLHVIVRR